MRWLIALALYMPVPAAASGLGMMAYYTGPESDRSLHAEAGVLTVVAADRYNVDGAGHVTGHTPPVVFSVARGHGIALLATVSNYGTHGFDRAVGHAVLTDPAIGRRAIAGMVRAMRTGFAGLNLDFENVASTDRAAYTNFASKLADAVHAGGGTLTLSVPAKDRDDPHDSWAGAYDFPALGGIADTLQVMTYDEHSGGGSAGPVAGLDWVAACMGYATNVVPRERVSEGMPAYGYDWLAGTTRARTVNWADIPALLAATGATPHWDARASSPWFAYTDKQGQRHVVWYENKRSIGLKAHLAETSGVASVSVWALGTDDPAYWRAIRSGL